MKGRIVIDRAQLDQMLAAEAYGSDGQKIGKVGQVYLDDSTGESAWATVNTGLFGTNETFIPLDQASYTGDRHAVPFGPTFTASRSLTTTSAPPPRGLRA